MNLVLENLTLSLGKASLSVQFTLRSRVSALFGPSGVGKTSLLETLAGLRWPVTGRIVLDGRVLEDRAAGVSLPARERRIGYVPQDLALFPHLSVEANLLYGSRHEGRRGRGGKVPLLGEVCEALEIAPLLERRPGTLSGGEQRRVALGRALLAGPSLLLLDEPLANLDAPLKARILPYLLEIRDRFGIPILYVTHDAREVERLCDEVVVLEAGRMLRHCDVAAFLSGQRDETGNL